MKNLLMLICEKNLNSLLFKSAKKKKANKFRKFCFLEVVWIRLFGEFHQCVDYDSLLVPDPPTDLRAFNVTDTTALLLWRPALATVDKYIIVYGAGTGE